MHENQLTYPLPDDPTTGPMRRQLGERDRHYAFINYASTVSYTHLDVYKRQVHQSWPQRWPGGGSSVTRKGTKRNRSGTGSFSSG